MTGILGKYVYFYVCHLAPQFAAIGGCYGLVIGHGMRPKRDGFGGVLDGLCNLGIQITKWAAFGAALPISLPSYLGYRIYKGELEV